MFSAYYDESGTHAGSPITVLGGFVGSMDDWAKFDREWRKILAKYDLRYIRAKQLFHKQGPYRGWTEKKLNYLWADILYVLQERKELQVSKIILRDEEYYQSYIAHCPISRRERLDTRYALCVRCAMHFLPMVHHRTKVKGVVNFVLESGHKNAGDALRVFSEIKERSNYEWARSIGTMSFGTKLEDTALQAADLISYWFYKTEMEKINRDVGDDPTGISFLEGELAQCGFHIIEHLITPSDLVNLRLNFSAKRRQKVFDKVRAIARADKLVSGAWGTEYAHLLIGAVVSEEQFDPANEVPLRRRQPID